LKRKELPPPPAIVDGIDHQDGGKNGGDERNIKGIEEGKYIPAIGQDVDCREEHGAPE
jgi:hypothetical protein